MPAFHGYTDTIMDLFKIKDGFKLELQMTEMIQQFGSRRKLIDTTKNGEKVVDVLLLQ